VSLKFSPTKLTTSSGVTCGVQGLGSESPSGSTPRATFELQPVLLAHQPRPPQYHSSPFPLPLIRGPSLFVLLSLSPPSFCLPLKHPLFFLRTAAWHFVWTEAEGNLNWASIVGPASLQSTFPHLHDLHATELPCSPDHHQRYNPPPCHQGYFASPYYHTHPSPCPGGDGTSCLLYCTGMTWAGWGVPPPPPGMPPPPPGMPPPPPGMPPGGAANAPGTGPLPACCRKWWCLLTHSKRRVNTIITKANHNS